ncbi:MAG: hypothetical protein ACKVYV_18515 [Limisphaerales bacterium]
MRRVRIFNICCPRRKLNATHLTVNIGNPTELAVLLLARGIIRPASP